MCFVDGSSARGSASGEEEWSEDMEEPEMEFDEMGLELAAQDGKTNVLQLTLLYFSCPSGHLSCAKRVCYGATICPHPPMNVRFVSSFYSHTSSLLSFAICSLFGCCKKYFRFWNFLGSGRRRLQGGRGN